MKNRLILIRHSKIDPAQPGAFVGSLNLSLSPAGVEAARGMNIHLDKGSFRLVCSPLKRATETAALLFPGHPMEFDPRLAEIDFGQWENRTFEQIKEESPQEVDLWANAPQEFTFPGGESVPGFIARVEELASDLVGQMPESKTTVAVTHGGVIRFLVCHLLKLSYERHLSFRCDRPSVNVIDLVDGFATLSGLNLDGYSTERL